jgi:hypothetical protein
VGFADGTRVVPSTLTCSDGRMSAAAVGRVDDEVDGDVDGGRDAVTSDQEMASAATASSAERRTTETRVTNLDNPPRPSPEADARK